MGADTIAETDAERVARENAEQAERLAADQDGLDAEPSNTKDGQAYAKRVDAPPEEIKVAGTTQLSMFDVGGKRAQSGKVTIQGMSGLPIMDQMGFLKGEFVRFEGVARVEEVAQKDKMDRKANQAVDCVQKHVAYATDVRFWPADSAALPSEASLEERVANVIQLIEASEVGDGIDEPLKDELLAVLRGS